MPLNDSKPKKIADHERAVQRAQLHGLGGCFINASVKVVFGLLPSIPFIEYVLCDR